jgi:hypothetical protein
LPSDAKTEIDFDLQSKTESSIPDATITQSSFKIVIETKLRNQFSFKQLMNHSAAFSDERYKTLLTIAPYLMKDEEKREFEEELDKFNKENKTQINHINMTFEKLIKEVYNVVDETDFQMLEILTDYEEYCNQGNLIPDGWKRMCVQLAGTTIRINTKLNLYYNNIDRGFSPYEYLGLYSNKAVRYIGKITSIITTIKKENELTFNIEKGELSEEMKRKIEEAIEDAKQYKYDLTTVDHRYFFVEEFIDTFFEKKTKYAPMGTRMFDLTELLRTEKIPKVREIAEKLKEVTW